MNGGSAARRRGAFVRARRSLCSLSVLHLYPVMPNDAADCRAGDRMMSRYMTCNPADGRALYTTVSATGGW